MTTDEVKESRGAKKLSEVFQHGMLEPLRTMIFEELEGIEVSLWFDQIEVYLHGELLTRDFFGHLFERDCKDEDFLDSDVREGWLEAAEMFEKAAATVRKKAKQ